jgi:hypothetical protein
MRRRPLMAQVYGALFEVSVLHDHVQTLRDDMSDAEVARFARRLEELTAEALKLVDRFEGQRRVLDH